MRPSRGEGLRRDGYNGGQSRGPTEELSDAVPTTLRRIADPGRRRLYALLVAVVLLTSVGVRLWHLTTPADYMFDEVYYAKDAKAIVDGRVGPKPPYRWEAGDEVSWPHPEMGKFAIAAGVLLFGDRAFGWRLPSVVAGLVILVCMYPLARRLGLPPPWALLALLFAAADPLGIAQSRIATLDIFVAAWTVLCVYLALVYVQSHRRRRWLFACGAAGGMALATKWSGALALAAAALVILVAWLVARRAARREARATVSAGGAPTGTTTGLETAGDAGTLPVAPRSVVRPLSATAAGRPRRHDRPARALVLALLALVALPAAIYVLSYVQYFAAGHAFADWRELQRQMWVFNFGLKASHSYASAAPTWIIDYRPVWYFFEDVKDTYRGVVAIGNPFLWWLATGFLVLAPLLALARRTTALLPAAALVVVLYLPWFAASRTSFLYYMTPVAPFLAVLVAAALAWLAGTGSLPRAAWLMATGAVVATAALWDPVVRLVQALGWWNLLLGATAATAMLAVLVAPRLRTVRPWVAMFLAGAVVGIVVAFLPVVLAIPISPEQFSRITWFPSWI